MSAPGISIALVTRDGGRTIGALLDAIDSQQIDLEVEIVAVDSGSTDETVRLLTGRVARLHRISSSDFDHGATRNLAVGLTRGELVVLMVQDALPADSGWLRELVAPLLADRAVAGSFARQLARSDASALSRRQLARWVAAGPEPRVTPALTAAQFDRLGPMERMDLSTFDDVCSCLRRSVWEQIPFAPTPMAEDLAWGRDAIRAGHRLAYAAGARVFHSHDRSVAYEMKRTFLLHRRLRELFGVRLVPSLGSLAVAILKSIPLHAFCAAAEWKRPATALRTLGLATVWPLGQYLGGRAAGDRGEPAPTMGA